MRELALQIPDELFVTLQQTAQSLNMTTHQLLLMIIKEKISSAQEIEIYTDEQIEQWTQADQLSTEERRHISQKVGISPD